MAISERSTCGPRCGRRRHERVLVTGGLGFVGSQLCRRLALEGRQVVCVDALRGTYAPPAGAGAAAELARELAVDVRLLDLTRIDLDRLVADVDAVVHLAGLPGVRQRIGLGELWLHNVALTARLCEVCAAHGVRLVFASSSSVYGDAPITPTPEDAPPAPLGLYAASKVAAEGACRRAHTDAGLDVVVVRLFTVFGPGQRPEMAIARWVDALLRDRPVPWHAPTGAARELTVVDDAVEGLIAALERGRSGSVYNVPGCGSVPLLTVLSLLEQLIGRRARLERLPEHPADVTVTHACGERARRELGYVPTRTLLGGLQRQVAAAAHAATARGRRKRHSGRPVERARLSM